MSTFNEDALMEQLSDQLLSHGNLSSAIRSLIQRGIRDSDGCFHRGTLLMTARGTPCKPG
jgi:predicted DNA-binding ribbon-helix-helix protein